MALFDKFNEVKNNFKASQEQKKAEQAAFEAEITEKITQLTNDILNQVTSAFDASKGLLFDDVDYNCAMTFAKDFYEKLVLPGGKTNTSCVSMHPYLDTKALEKIGKKFASYDTSDAPLLYIKDSAGQQIVFTTKGLYFKVALPDNPKYFAEGCISTGQINDIRLELNEKYFDLLCNGVKITSVNLVNAYKQDCISLGEYFRCLKENDFDISDAEIDSLIHRKIGDKIYQSIRKYMTDEDEIVLFYAGGLDSLAATDYIACTSKQIIIVNRELLGTANVKQFYYEDISAMQTIQNSNSGDLMVDLISSAIVSACKTCDLEISVAGSKERINTLFMIEAQRVVAIYHEKRKELKTASHAPVQQVVQQVVQQPDILEQVEKLAKLKDAGVLSEEEFAAKKADLLAKL